MVIDLRLDEYHERLFDHANELQVALLLLHVLKFKAAQVLGLFEGETGGKDGIQRPIRRVILKQLGGKLCELARVALRERGERFALSCQ